MTLLKTTLALVLGASLLSGCGSISANDATYASLIGTVKERVKNKRAIRKAGPARAPKRSDFAGVKQPIISAYLEKDDLLLGLILNDIKPPVLSWTTIDRVGMTFADARLIQTRNFRGDLMASSQTGPLRVGSYPLERRTLDGENQQIAQNFTCTMRNEGTETITVLEIKHKTQKFTEHCQGTKDTTGSFTNTYWQGGDIVWRGRHFITEDMGYVVVERLVK